jgi:hypothetical protein
MICFVSGQYSASGNSFSALLLPALATPATSSSFSSALTVILLTCNDGNSRESVGRDIFCTSFLVSKLLPYALPVCRIHSLRHGLFPEFRVSESCVPIPQRSSVVSRSLRTFLDFIFVLGTCHLPPSAIIYFEGRIFTQHVLNFNLLSVCVRTLYVRISAGRLLIRPHRQRNMYICYDNLYSNYDNI